MAHQTTRVTRFAPSPTGRLHVGSAYSALFADRAARNADGIFLLRIEDIDQNRCRPEFETGIFEDLAWLGLLWPTPVRRQSDHMADYTSALDQLKAMDLIYPCFCTRADIRREIDSAAGAPHLARMGPDGPLYPGTCRAMHPSEAQDRIDAGDAHAFRLTMDRAIAVTGPLMWVDADQGEQFATPDIFGDVVLARKDAATSYHMAATLDDHLQGITMVTRGEDLAPAAHIHRLLQALLNLHTPAYQHHKLLTDDTGRRFSKRDQDLTIAALRESGKSPDDVFAMIGWPD